MKTSNHQDGLAASGPRAARRRAWLGLLSVLVVCLWLNDSQLWRPDDWIGIESNVQVAEAEAWRQGRLDLAEREWDTALFKGKVYSHFPPLFSFVSVACLGVFGGVPHGLMVFGIAAPLAVLAYTFFLRRTGSPCWGTVCAIGLVCGTSVWPVLRSTIRGASPYHVNQSLAVIGTLVLLHEYFGRRRIWLAGLGVLGATLSRQLTVAYLIPLGYMAWKDRGSSGRFFGLGCFALTTVAAAAISIGLNTLKFGHPLDTGYLYIYDDRPEDDFSRDARAFGLFSPHFVPRNLYFSNLGLPTLTSIRTAGEDRTYLRPNRMGTGIWWTTPLLLWLIIDLRRILRDRELRVLFAATCLVFAALTCFHATGSIQRGFHRFSLDYLPVLLALIVPRCLEGRRRWVTLAMVAWSVLYFAVLLPLPHIRVW